MDEVLLDYEKQEKGGISSVDSCVQSVSPNFELNHAQNSVNVTAPPSIQCLSGETGTDPKEEDMYKQLWTDGRNLLLRFPRWGKTHFIRETAAEAAGEYLIIAE